MAQFPHLTKRNANAITCYMLDVGRNKLAQVRTHDYSSDKRVRMIYGNYVLPPLSYPLGYKHSYNTSAKSHDGTFRLSLNKCLNKC